jgi:hypothetical protein
MPPGSWSSEAATEMVLRQRYLFESDHQNPRPATRGILPMAGCATGPDTRVTRSQFVRRGQG